MGERGDHKGQSRVVWLFWKWVWQWVYCRITLLASLMWTPPRSTYYPTPPTHFIPPIYSLLCTSVFRLGTSVTQFRTALDTIHLQNPLLRFLITVTKLNRGFYLLIDHLVWASRMNLVTIKNQYWSRLANQCWLVALILGLLRDLYELFKAWSSAREYQTYGQSVTTKEVCSVLQNNPAICVDLVKNGGDLFIPLSRLDLIYLPGGVVGLLGVVSSLAGLLATYNERLKLKFS